jgi:cytochrome c oxidase subunit II
VPRSRESSLHGRITRRAPSDPRGACAHSGRHERGLVETTTATLAARAGIAAALTVTRRSSRRRSAELAWALALVAVGCEGPQSALEPAGRGATQIDGLFWLMTIGLAVVWLVVVTLAIYAYRGERTVGEPAARRLIVVGGVVVPVVVLTALLAYGLSTMPALLPSAQRADVEIDVIGHQYWWRVRYLRDGVPVVELANELHLPAGKRVELVLESRDVIHSFWIPSLGGKVDMIPGRTTRLVLEPEKPGIYRGTCAEYCGASHAWMSFYAIVEEPERFERWLVSEASPARAPTDPVAARGAQLFLATGCGACHAIRGTAADGVIGPDLTHVGGRHSLAAGALPNDRSSLRRWISRTIDVKPAVHMPTFGMLSHATVDALAAYLEGLP